jgi:hypothetical protein
MSANPNSSKLSTSSAATNPQAQALAHVKCLEELQKQEVERAIRQKREEEVQLEVGRRLRDNPNRSIHDLQSEVGELNRKVEPLLKRIEEAAGRVGTATEGGPFKKGPVGMLSKMGGRMISFYADDLTDMLLSDFLVETALELQRMEDKELKNYVGNEAKVYAESLLKNIVDYQSEEAEIQLKWNAVKGGKAGKPLGSQHLALTGPSQPNPISGVSFNLNDDLRAATLDVSHSISASQGPGYKNPFSQSRSVDPFT